MLSRNFKKASLWIQRASRVLDDKRPFAVEIAIIWVISLALMAVIYPELVFHARIRFTAGHDIAVPFQAAFLHARYFVNGGIPLWDLYDQVDHAYFQLGTGFHTIPAILEGGIFALLHSLFAHPANAFYRVHAVGFFAICALFRTIGGFALLSLYPMARGSRILALLILNTLLAAQTYTGLMVAFIYSLTPLVLFYLVLLYRRSTISAGFWFVAAFALSFAQVPLIAIGYFYAPIHFMILTMLVLKIWDYYRNSASMTEPDWRRFRLSAKGITAALCVSAIIAMNVNYLLDLRANYFLAGSGIGGTEGRFSHILNPFYYLNFKYIGVAAVSDFLPGSLNIDKHDWWYSWPYLGSSVIALSIIGLLYGSYREKWIFAATLILNFAMQTPRLLDPGITLPIHFVNAFTNPFSFLLIHVHMSALMLPYFLLPLVAMGIDTVREWARAPSRLAQEKWRDRIAAAVFIILMVYSYGNLPAASGTLATSIFFGFLGVLLIARRPPAVMQFYGKFIVTCVLLFSVIGDWKALELNLKIVPYTGDKVVPRIFSGLEDVGPTVVDHQNPMIQTLPRHVWAADLPSSPATDKNFVVPYALYFERQLFFGSYFRTVFISRQLMPVDTYEERAKQYRTAVANAPFKQTLLRDDRFIYHATDGLDARQYSLAELAAVRGDINTVLLEAPDGSDVANLGNGLPLYSGDAAAPTPPPPLRYEFDLKEAKVSSRWQRELSLVLPKDFPSWIATTVFTADSKEIRAYIGDMPLTPAQGVLSRPNTFDVNNVAAGRVVVATAPMLPNPTGKLRLEVDQDPLIRDVWTLGGDTLGLDYNAPSDGWMVIRNPYQKGWRATVNGSSAPVLIANTFAMAVPVKTGKNKVLLEYKPGFFVFDRLLVYLGIIGNLILATILVVDALEKSVPNFAALMKRISVLDASPIKWSNFRIKWRST
jgi:hypothetical protein